MTDPIKKMLDTYKEHSHRPLIADAIEFLDRRLAALESRPSAHACTVDESGGARLSPGVALASELPVADEATQREVNRAVTAATAGRSTRPIAAPSPPVAYCNVDGGRGNGTVCGDPAPCPKHEPAPVAKDEPKGSVIIDVGAILRAEEEERRRKRPAPAPVAGEWRADGKWVAFSDCDDDGAYAGDQAYAKEIAVRHNNDMRRSLRAQASAPPIDADALADDIIDNWNGTISDDAREGIRFIVRRAVEAQASAPTPDALFMANYGWCIPGWLLELIRDAGGAGERAAVLNAINAAKKLIHAEVAAAFRGGE